MNWEQHVTTFKIKPSQTENGSWPVEATKTDVTGPGSKVLNQVYGWALAVLHLLHPHHHSHCLSSLMYGWAVLPLLHPRYHSHCDPGHHHYGHHDPQHHGHLDTHQEGHHFDAVPIMDPLPGAKVTSIIHSSLWILLSSSAERLSGDANSKLISHNLYMCNSGFDQIKLVFCIFLQLDFIGLRIFLLQHHWR